MLRNEDEKNNNNTDIFVFLSVPFLSIKQIKLIIETALSIPSQNEEYLFSVDLNQDLLGPFFEECG